MAILLAGLGLCMPFASACSGATADTPYCEAAGGFSSSLEGVPAKDVKRRALAGFGKIAGAAPPEVGPGWRQLVEDYRSTFSEENTDVRERVAELKENLAELANDVKDRCNVEFQIPGG